MMITYLHVIMNFKGAEEDCDSVVETNLPGILTSNGLIFMGKEHTTKSTKIYPPQKFLSVQYIRKAVCATHACMFTQNFISNVY